MANYTIGLAGLQNTSLAIDTTSNNIANANTVGYKAGDYVFADQYFKATSPSDSNRVGLGSQRLAVRRPLTYGTINNSANPLDMAIGGDGWFRVLTNPDDPTSLNYTRNGQFAVDKNGWIVNENGMYLTGYQPSADGTRVLDDIRGPGSTNGKLKMPADFANGVQTTVSTISATLDSRENAFVKGIGNTGVAFDPNQNTFNAQTTQTIFDLNGASHTLNVYYRRVTDSNMTISVSSSGYSYAPGPNNSPNTLQRTAVTLPPTSTLSIVSAPKNTILSKAAGYTATTLGTDSSITLSTNLVKGDKVYMNGVDTGLTVAASVNAGTVASDGITFNGSLSVPSGAVFTFFPSDAVGKPAANASSGATQFTFTSDGNTPAPTVGQKLYLNGVDTGSVVTLVTTNGSVSTVTVDTALPSNILAPVAAVTANPSATPPVSAVSAVPGTPVTFKTVLDMNLVAPDGTNIAVKGTSNNPALGQPLTALRENVEVYASIDGTRFYNTDAASSSDRVQTPEVQGSYRAVAVIGMIGGRNIDSLMTDAASGKPVFSTKAKLTTTVSNGSQQSSVIPLIFDLDLSGTQLQASSFQMNQSSQNGEARSQLSSVSIDSNGQIVGVYGNGRQIVAGAIALAHFDASEQLVPTGGNSFAPSYRSGTEGDNGVRIGRPGEGSFGAIKSQAVEQSNVDLSNELVKLMLLQRVYSANSQSLRAFDQTMQDTIRMVG
jgi:flagellar hook protein FlgE